MGNDVTCVSVCSWKQAHLDARGGERGDEQGVCVWNMTDVCVGVGLLSLTLCVCDVQGKHRDNTPYGEYGGWYKACKVNRYNTHFTSSIWVRFFAFAVRNQADTSRSVSSGSHQKRASLPFILILLFDISTIIDINCLSQAACTIISDKPSKAFFFYSEL